MAKYGALHGVTKQAVTLWKRRGLLVFEGDKVNVEASDTMLKKYRAVGITGSQVTEDEIPARLVALIVAGLEADIDLTGISLTVDGVTMTIAQGALIREDYLALKKAKRLKLTRD